MTTDQELLELAAKAAGYQVDGPASKYMVQGYTFDSLLRLNEQGGHSVWNPLTDDGDALRLAIALKLDILWAEHENSVVACNDSSNDEPVCKKVRFISEAGPATRRAIVHAAAEIGKTL